MRSQLSKGESSRQVDFSPAPLPLPPERQEPPEEEEKEALPLQFFLFLPDWPEGEEDNVSFWAGRAPEELACPEPDADDPADPPAAAGFRGILGGWRVCCTRASFAAARILVNAESNKGDGKRATVSGRGEYLKRVTSSAGTVEQTSASKESRLERARLPRAVQPWLARNSKALDPERINCSKSARTSSGRCFRKPLHVDSHQSSHDETSQTPESMVSIEETCEADKETERFLTSLGFSGVMEVTPGGTEYGPGKEEEEVR